VLSFMSPLVGHCPEARAHHLAYSVSSGGRRARGRGCADHTADSLPVIRAICP
jgi:hypothetical protein